MLISISTLKKENKIFPTKMALCDGLYDERVYSKYGYMKIIIITIKRLV